ncbi:type ISP restriction/modification enzyme [Rhizobium sp. BK379]|uniref:DEAD/DEAH box helicase n=1 Tax=Rhizobium sp. BK379 TaxID=2587059 RepID=UPI00162059E7|nr:type ISP restriction/modification enzyme [Rhizobium sp. BK379]MBB3441851.1 putative helicase [Rhizobium sp. BK379]
MSSALKELFDRYRTGSKSEREKGTYFENLAKVFFENDPQYVQRFDKVWTYAEFASEKDISAQDTGIDLVARVRDEGGFCAIQCKFYREGHRIQKSDIDSFFTASGKRPFTERLIIDTTNANWSEHAEGALQDQNISTQRIGFSDIQQSPIDWTTYIKDSKVVLTQKKELRPHQKEALAAVKDGFAAADRGKLIMACGTGKTFTGLKIAEDFAGVGKMVLYLVPSLALMSQSVREWSIDTETPLRCFAVCSDVQVGRRRSGDDLGDIDIHDLAYPATTDAKVLAAKVNAHPDLRMTVVFSTYQSIQTISDAQKKFDLPEFDLIICDEAHRTTGAKFEGEEESSFIKVHNQDFIQGKKRLYMTATPRIFGDAVKTKAGEASVELCSMDDASLYGEVLFQRGFSWAVQNGLLTDYKVVVLAVDEAVVSAGVQHRLADEHSELVLDDATKIIGCYKALTKEDLKQDVSTDPLPMKRALAFCKDIKSSKLITDEFAKVLDEYLTSGNVMDGFAAEKYRLQCELEHVDGTFNAKARNERLNWLKEDTDESTCRILSNARCLSEGVDVPALDAIMFLHPRKSQIDVVQSVGRVMRRAPGKKMGYVILPVGIPAGVEPEEALNNNEKYRVVWQILNALRAHDDRFDATINKMDLGVDVSNQIEIVAVTNDLPNRNKPERAGLGIGQGGSADEREDTTGASISEPAQTSFVFDEISRAILARIVKKCGRRSYWEDWATDIGRVAQTHITRIKALVDQPDSGERKAFVEFLAELRDDLNDSITEDEAVEMLAQHLITQPVFEALFEGYNFTKENPVSRAMQGVLDALHEHNLEKESASLQKFYADVRVRASGIDNAEGKQRIVVELYDKFFRNAFPKMTERLGIVYTPVEVVDFIIHSVNEVLQSEFGQTLGSRGVHILDPFTGTGTFITRLLQSGLIRPDELEHKYRKEIHANEIVLLAYYIAAINIEATYHGLAGGDYVPFEGICLTDTFQLYEQERDLVSDLMADNSSRRTKQKELDIRVIVGNPPYSSGQNSANDHAANIDYPKLDERIRDTFVALSGNANKRAIYDSYTRAIRWASDRLGDRGVVGFVTSAAWVDGTALDGLRKSLEAEFSSIFVFHLRGNQRTSGERSRKEGGKIFGSGSRAPISINILVKNPDASTTGNIFFHDIGDYLTRQEKLERVSSLGSIKGIEEQGQWLKIHPDKHGDWLQKREAEFDAYINIGDKRDKSGTSLFKTYSRGVATARDAWVYNSSKDTLARIVDRSISTFNRSQAEKRPVESVDGFKWCENTIKDYRAGKSYTFDNSKITLATYRPFFRQWLYFDKTLNWSAYRMPLIFPDRVTKNRMIVIEGSWRQNGYLAIMCDSIHALMPDGGCQCFPLYVLEERSGDLLGTHQRGMNDGITDYGLAHFQALYPGVTVTKDELFYYVYGLLHSEDYLSRFADNLSKQLPRIPAVKNAADFRAIAEAGRKLGELHCNYEQADPYPVTFKQGSLELAVIKDREAFYRVEKMKFGGKRPNVDKTTVVYNSNITMTGIPIEAYDYVVNGKPALEWVMERQGVKTDAASGIVNDANRYAIETIGDAAYPLELFQRVITVSLETMKIVRALPKLEI